MIITPNSRIIQLSLLLVFMLPLIAKALQVERFLYFLTATRFGAIQVIAHDALIYSSIFLLFYLSLLAPLWRVVAIILRTLAFLLFGLYIVDYIVLVSFHTRLTLIDILKYASYTPQYIQQIYNGRGILILFIVLVITGALVLGLFSQYKIKDFKTHRRFVFIILSFWLASYFTNNKLYVHSWVYQNFIDYNLIILSESSKYSDDFIKNFSFEDQKHCTPNQPIKKNIIILMVESLSSYQSQLFSGIKDWTPHLDSIAKQNGYYTNFYANGFTTEDGEIALLTGLLPIYPPSNYTNGGGTSFKGFYDIRHSLPNVLKQQGYTTEFLTSADLEFANTGHWAKSIGFDYIEGHEHPDYNNWPRFHFKSAPDEALYHRVLERMAHNDNKNYFLFIKTASSHHPFRNPVTNNHSEAETFKYVDRQIGVFYNKLVDNHFFNNGLLVIVGDHHAMIPLKKEEIAILGPLRASAKVPMIISYGNNTSSIEHEPYQQVDIFNSLINLISNTQCYSDWVGHLMGDNKQPAKYIAHRRGDNRNIISVFFGDTDFLIKLEGDQTRIIKSAPVKETISKLIVNKINQVRICTH